MNVIRSSPSKIKRERRESGRSSSGRSAPIVALAKLIRAMADGNLDSRVGARICNGLGIMRACLETRKLEQLESRMDEIVKAQRLSH
jgi:hypothetical protein